MSNPFCELSFGSTFYRNQKVAIKVKDVISIEEDFSPDNLLFLLPSKLN